MKYRNKKCEYMGIKFDSLGERDRYIYLKSMESQGIIEELTLQPVFRINVHGVKICDYRGDFRYFHNGAEVIEDFKGIETPVFKLKKKLVLAVFGKEIRIVKKPTEEIAQNSPKKPKDRLRVR